MSITENIELPPGPDTDAVLAYLEAQGRKSFADHATFFAADVHFNGLVLNASGAERIAEEMDRFLPAIAHLSVDAAARVESGDPSRYLVLYKFQLTGQAEPQPLCDHITVAGGVIVRVDNIFDVTTLPPMG